MNYYLYCLRRFARLILLLWIVFRIAPLAAQDRAARLDFQVRKATLDTFVRQLEDSTGFSFIYGELNAELVAKVLGVSISSAYELMHEEVFPSMRIGSRFVVPKDKFQQWVERKTGGAR